MRAGRQGNRPHAEGAACRDRLRAGARRAKAADAAAAPADEAAGARRHVARQSRRGDLRLAHAAQQAGLREGDLAHRIRSDRMRPRLPGRRRVRALSAQRSGAGRRGAQGARRAAGFPDRRPHVARGADRRRFARARARHAVPAVLLHHRRRAAEEGAGAGRRRGPGRRCRDARRAGGDREILRRAARSRGLHRGARSAAAAALFDLVVAEGAQGPRVAHRRYGALRHRQAQAARRRLDLPRRPRRAGRQAPRLCAEGACTSACRPIPPCRSS